MKYALILLGIAALGGLAMAGMRFAGNPRPPSWLAMLHGLLAAAGLTLLIEAALTTGLPSPGGVGLGLLLIAAVGGAAINLLYHDRQLPLPKSWIVGHALLAVAGYGLLLATLF
ncbi:MAG TPA: hypothetical protein VGH80_02435 [Xanthomonadaceae bacterium]|jgi:hypothetical protein